MTYLVEQHTQIQINQVRKFLKIGHGFKFTTSRNGTIEQTLNAFWKNDHLIFEWFKDGKILTQKTYLAKSKTNFGSERLWWKCPNCARSCGALFDYGGAWCCRDCGNLKYKTASGSKSEREIAYFNRFRERYLSESNHVGIDYLMSHQRPKWMRKVKWEVLRAEHNNHVEQFFRKISTKFDLSNRR